MSEWMTVRAVLTGRPNDPLARQPGRLVLVHTEHTFADLADCLDPAFGRWDLTPGHQFAFDGWVVASAVGAGDADSEEVTLADAGLQAGTRFAYEFDPDERWHHVCEVVDDDVDPYELADDEPDDPLCVDGWGPLPDQYGREEDDGDWEIVSDADADAERAASWAVVAHALPDRPTEPDEAALLRAVTALRADPDVWPHRLLWGIAEATPATTPDDAVAAWLTLAGGMLEPFDLDEPADAGEAAALAALEPADWAGAIIELVREGVGAAADPPTLCQRVLACPEIEGDPPSQEDTEVLQRGLAVAVPLWEALGAVDRHHRLTALGAWGLPEALRAVWTTEDRAMAGQ